MNIIEAEQNLKKITKKFSKETFIFDLMTAYDFPKSTISKLKIKNKNHDDVVVPSKLHFVSVSKKELDSKFNELVKNYATAKKAPRFIIVTDYQSLKAYDTKAAEKLDTEIKNLSKHPDFFLPWIGIEKKIFQGENPADVKAAEKLAKLFDLILKDNIKLVEKNRHALNVFLTRILFCFFAEDTDIFKKGLLTESLASHTKVDGNDLDDYLQRLFQVLNKKSRTGLPDFLKEFPYVNGGLFAEESPIPKFSKKSRESLIDLGSDLNWAEINPDIFGSMIQAVVHPDQRAGLGMHYTSVTNIMKVIEPLFLAELKEEFANAKENKNRLKKLLERIGNIKVFDPACGSGNFLIIAYKELRILEMDILKALGEIPMSGITLSNFYGIEIDDFAHEVAKLSLWLAEHQMDVLFNSKFGHIKASLPLKESGRIVFANALEVDWKEVCKCDNDEVYIIGNPPYLGGKSQSSKQKKEMALVFKGFKNFKELDYIACWFLKASRFINQKSKFAFVSTSSINQGAQVVQLWPELFSLGLEIMFVHKPFLWSNNAKGNAAVTVVVIGMRHFSNEKKTIYHLGKEYKVKNINGYLTTGSNLVIESRLKPLSSFPRMITGNSPYDNNFLRLNTDEKKALIKDFPQSTILFRKAIGAIEMIKSLEKWCLWISDDKRTLAESIPPIKKRIEKTRDFRLNGGDVAKAIVDRPHQFRYTHTAKSTQIVVPIHTSDRRKYIPIGFFDEKAIILSSAAVIYDPPFYLFSILCSRIHNCWVQLTAGRLKSDYRYLSATCYNTFPFPEISKEQINELELCGMEILKEREKLAHKSLLELYDPEKMHPGLLEAHRKNDEAVERCYTNQKLITDEERMEILFKEYASMIRAKEKAGN